MLSLVFKIKKISIILLLSSSIVLSQSKETCTSELENSVLDLNSITKCSISKKEESTSGSLSLEIKSRRRVIRNRNSVKGISYISNNSKIQELKTKASLVGKLNLSNKNTWENMPSTLVEQIPLFDQCKKVPLLKQRKCFKEQLISHIKRNFKYPEEAFEKSIQGRVLINFVINKEGNIDNIITRDPYKGELLSKEAKRIIKKLPKFIPGKNNGELVNVRYGIPINFVIPGKKKSNIKPISISENNNVYSFDKTTSLPRFEDCKNDNSSKCFNLNLVEYLEANLIYPEEAIKNNLEGKIYVYFEINKLGKINNIKVKYPKNGDYLKTNIEDLLESLPTFIPAKIKSKKVITKYSFPINFSLGKNDKNEN